MQTVVTNQNNNDTTNTGQGSIMESELKSLQSKIMDLENKLSFTHNDESDIHEELLKSGIMLPPGDMFQSIDERDEFGR